jgi:hypothetical protein
MKSISEERLIELGFEKSNYFEYWNGNVLVSIDDDGENMDILVGSQITTDSSYAGKARGIQTESELLALCELINGKKKLSDIRQYYEMQKARFDAIGKISDEREFESEIEWFVDQIPYGGESQLLDMLRHLKIHVKSIEISATIVPATNEEELDRLTSMYQQMQSGVNALCELTGYKGIAEKYVVNKK